MAGPNASVDRKRLRQLSLPLSSKKIIQKYKILFCEADTGIVLKDNGESLLENSNHQNKYPEFDKLEDALSYKDRLLDQFPFGEVSIINDDEVKVYRNEKQLEIYLQERSEIYRWYSLPFFIKWFKKRPECKIYKGR